MILVPEPVFLDTSGLLALLRERDAGHQRAVEALELLHAGKARVFTSEWVCAELLASASARGVRRQASQFVRGLMANPRVRVLPATHAGWLAALALYEARHDKEWSLVDCHSILACKASKITRVLTSDHHFRQAGLQPLM